MRASTEYAPGPSIATDAVIRMDKARWTTPRSLRSDTAAISTQHAKTDTTGVKIPMPSDAASKQTPPTSHMCTVGSCVGRTFVKSIAATEKRSKTNATPANPVGNMENSLCTAERLAVIGTTGKPGESVHEATLSGGIAFELGRVTTFSRRALCDLRICPQRAPLEVCGRSTLGAEIELESVSPVS